MRFISYLNEVYIDTFESPITHQSYEVFKNPDKKEIHDLYVKHKDEESGIRFYIDLKKKDVYMFCGDMLHHVVKEKMKLNTKETYKNGPRWLWGEGDYTAAGKVEIAGITNDIPEEADWIGKYFIYV